MSSSVANDLWARAIDALKVARMVADTSPDSAASRAYYAAFYAASAHFAMKDRHFRKHTAVEAAIHRDLVRTGIWAKELGADYTALQELRSLGDYGVMEHVSEEDAQQAVLLAEKLLHAVSQLHHDTLKMPSC